MQHFSSFGSLLVGPIFYRYSMSVLIFFCAPLDESFLSKYLFSLCSIYSMHMQHLFFSSFTSLSVGSIFYRYSMSVLMYSLCSTGWKLGRYLSVITERKLCYICYVLFCSIHSTLSTQEEAKTYLYYHSQHTQLNTKASNCQLKGNNCNLQSVEKAAVNHYSVLSTEKEGKEITVVRKKHE